MAVKNAEAKLKAQKEKVDKSQLAKDVAARELGFQQYKLGQAYATREHVSKELSGESGLTGMSWTQPIHCCRAIVNHPQ